MKSKKGITLTSLVIYVIVMIIALATIGTIIRSFNQNVDSMETDTDDILQFNKFNAYFLKEIKAKGNKIDAISTNYILFNSGNSFSLSNNKIYYNNLEICKGVKTFNIAKGKDGDGVSDDIVYVTIQINSFKKSINYKVEQMY